MLTFSIIGLLLLENVGSAVAVKSDMNNDSGFNNSADCKSQAGSEAKIKNVIVMVPDDCSQSVQTLARWYSGGPLHLDEMTAGVAAKIGKDISSENIKSQLKTWWDIDPADDDVTEILEFYNNAEGLSLDYAISKVISQNHTIIGWTTHGPAGKMSLLGLWPRMSCRAHG